MSGHTPGPWTWFTGKKLSGTSQVTKHFVGSNGQGFGLTVGLNEPEDTANANLIIAVLELLEAVKECVQTHDTLVGWMPGKTDPPAIVKARAAIAKAEGRT